MQRRVPTVRAVSMSQFLAAVSPSETRKDSDPLGLAQTHPSLCTKQSSQGVTLLTPLDLVQQRFVQTDCFSWETTALLM